MKNKPQLTPEIIALQKATDAIEAVHDALLDDLCIARSLHFAAITPTSEAEYAQAKRSISAALSFLQSLSNIADTRPLPQTVHRGVGEGDCGLPD